MMTMNFTLRVRKVKKQGLTCTKIDLCILEFHMCKVEFSKIVETFQAMIAGKSHY